MALAFAPWVEVANSQFYRPSANARMAFSIGLLSMLSSPSSQ